jgi:hypothetical protein
MAGGGSDVACWREVGERHYCLMHAWAREVLLVLECLRGGCDVIEGLQPCWSSLCGFGRNSGL